MPSLKVSKDCDAAAGRLGFGVGGGGLFVLPTKCNQELNCYFVGHLLAFGGPTGHRKVTVLEWSGGHISQARGFIFIYTQNTSTCTF